MTEPIRKSLLPCTPPPEWEFSTVLGQPSGCLLVPDAQYAGFPVVRRRVSYGDWEPVTPDHWAEEPETDAAASRQCSPACSEQHTYEPPCELAHAEAQPESSDPTQCTGDDGFCPEHGFHRHSLKQSAPAKTRTDVGTEFVQQVDAIDDTTLAAAEEAIKGVDDTDLTEADIDRMMADGVPVQIVTGPPPTHAVPLRRLPRLEGPAADGVGPAPAGTVDNPAGLRERVAAALHDAYQDSYQEGYGLPYDDMVDAVLAVRDTELQQLRDQVNGWRRKAVQRAIRLGRHETTLAAVREFAAEEVTARNGWGDGYREAKRDLTELIDTLAPADDQPARDR